MRVFLQIYPVRLVLLVLYVQVTAIFINFQVFEFREIFVIFCWIPLFTLLYLLTKNKIVYKAVLILFFIDGFINLCHWLIIKGPLSASSFFIIANTNMNEALEFMDLKFHWRILLIIPYVLLFIYALRKTPKVVLYPKSKYIIGIIFLISIIFITENAINGRFIRKAVPTTVKTLVSFYEEMEIYKSLKQREIKEVEATLTDKEEEQIFLLIIGESCNRNHMSLYGYQRETSPKLKVRKDIFVFDDVVSPYSNTLNSILTILTNSNLENDIKFDNNVSLIDIFHSAGFKTYWISNQSPIGVWDNGVFNLAQTSDVIKFENNSGNSSYESTLISSYDEILLNPLQAVLNDDAKNKFIIMHLMGSHSNYKKRYPKKFDFFKNYSNKKERIINEYDNSILYNDFIIDSIFNIINSHNLKNSEIISSAIYLSDHGENVYDEDDNAGHDYSGSLPKSNIEIPFIVWLSGNYINKYPNREKSISKNIGLPFVTDDLFNAVIDLNNIETPYFENQRSIFNPEYNSQRIRILEDGMDYDCK